MKPCGIGTHNPLNLNDLQDSNNVAKTKNTGAFGSTLRPRLYSAPQDQQSLQVQLTEARKRIETLELEVGQARREQEQDHSETKKLADEIEQLFGVRQTLGNEIKSLAQEKTRFEEQNNHTNRELETSSKRLSNVLNKLELTEKKIDRLRNLETELEKSVVRSQRSELSRRGLYQNDENDLTSITSKAERDFCRQLIDRLELFDSIIGQFRSRSKTAAQLTMLRDSFSKLLTIHSVDTFDFKPGTELTLENRKDILLIDPDEINDTKIKRDAHQRSTHPNKPTVIRTIKPGYLYKENGRNVVIRKAEVVLAS